MQKRNRGDKPQGERVKNNSNYHNNENITNSDAINKAGGKIKNSFFVRGRGGKGMRFEWFERFHYWWLGNRSIVRSLFRVVAAKQTIGIVTSVLFTAYIMAAFYTHAGEFIIKVEHPGEKRLVLSDTMDFSEELITLNGEAIKNADNINILDIAPDVAHVNGEHNGRDYVAYTFYAKNIGTLPITYDYTLQIKRATKGIEEASWVLLYYNDKHHVYAKESNSGGAEAQYAEFELPFKDEAADESQYGFDEATGIYSLTTKPFVSSNVVSTDVRAEMQPGDVDKFTVVIWLEGEDPECVDKILGGTLEMMMKFRY